MLESANKAITHNFSQQEKELARQTEIQYDTVSPNLIPIPLKLFSDILNSIVSVFQNIEIGVSNSKDAGKNR